MNPLLLFSPPLRCGCCTSPRRGAAAAALLPAATLLLSSPRRTRLLAGVPPPAAAEHVGCYSPTFPVLLAATVLHPTPSARPLPTRPASPPRRRPAQVGLQVVWNILIHDILGFFNHGGGPD